MGEVSAALFTGVMVTVAVPEVPAVSVLDGDMLETETVKSGVPEVCACTTEGCEAEACAAPLPL